jgi:hypothetical protein
MAKLLIVVARIFDQEKYKLPTNVAAMISTAFPQSRASLIVAANGGAFTFSSVDAET